MKYYSKNQNGFSPIFTILLLTVIVGAGTSYIIFNKEHDRDKAMEKITKDFNDKKANFVQKLPQSFILTTDEKVKLELLKSSTASDVAKGTALGNIPEKDIKIFEQKILPDTEMYKLLLSDADALKLNEYASKNFKEITTDEKITKDWVRNGYEANTTGIKKDEIQCQLVYKLLPNPNACNCDSGPVRIDCWKKSPQAKDNVKSYMVELLNIAGLNSINTDSIYIENRGQNNSIDGKSEKVSGNISYIHINSSDETAINDLFKTMISFNESSLMQAGYRVTKTDVPTPYPTIKLEATGKKINCELTFSLYTDNKNTSPFEGISTKDFNTKFESSCYNKR